MNISIVPFDVPMDLLAEMTQRASATPHGRQNGPTTLDSRYVTEDVPPGLVPTIRPAALAGVPVPLHEERCAADVGALHRRDFAAENDILPRAPRLRCRTRC